MKAAALWNALIVKNPMLIEIQRYRRRYLSFSGANAVNSAVLALALLCYTGIILLVCNFRNGIPPIVLVGCQTFLFTVFAPGMLYATIAGERERRSWDLLLVAPITKAQIVVGKFIGALTALGIAAAFLVVPIFISAITYGSDNNFAGADHTNWWDLLTSEMVSLSFTVCVCALTILFSARVKRPFMALANTLGLLILSLAIFPAFIGGMGLTNASDTVLFFLHPFVVIGQLSTIGHIHNGEGYGGVAPALWGWPQVFIYLGLAAILIGWATNTLVFAENDVKFIPKGSSNA